MIRHRTLRAACALLAVAALASCTESDPISTADAGRMDGGTSSTTRAIRGKVPVRTGARRISRVNVINAANGRTIGSATPDASGNWVVNGVPKGATYKITFVAGNRAIPMTFKKAATGTAKTNLFKVGARASRTGNLDGDINVGELASTMEGGEEQLSPMNDMQAPNQQEDFDGDGMVDAADSDVDGDGTSNEMDMDNDGDGMPDNAQFGDQDGDGVTNESDSDMDGDGTANENDTDNDNDGTPDAMDTSPNGNTVGSSEDSDGDGIPNMEDTTDPDDNDVEEDPDGGTHDDASMHGEDVPPDPPFEGCVDSPYAHSSAPHWTYDEQDTWDELMGADGGTPFATCMGPMMQQTPVNITGTFASESNALTFRNYGNVPLRILNNGHTVQVNVYTGSDAITAMTPGVDMLPQVDIGGTPYYLVQFHGHTQSEHRVENQQLPMEWHFVHSTNGLLNGTGSIAVIGVFFNTPAGATANGELDALLTRAPRNELNRLCMATTVNLDNLLPDNRSYYHYSPGSLTTPPCTKGLNWFVLSSPIATTAAQASRLMERIGGHTNARNVQPLGARMITRYVDGDGGM